MGTNWAKAFPEASKRLNVLAEQVRAMDDRTAEATYRSLRDRLHDDYQHLAGSAARNRRKEIEKLRGIGGRHGDKADGLEQEFEQEQAAYNDGVELKSLLAVRTGRLQSYASGSQKFRQADLSK